MLSESDKKNFETLQRAFLHDNAALMECRRVRDGMVVPVICTVQQDVLDGQYVFTPFAMMFNEQLGNPYEELTPPDPRDPKGFLGAGKEPT